MRHFPVLSITVLFALDCGLQYAQSSVSPVAFSESQDIVQAFSDAGPITLPVMRRLIDITYPDGKKERGDLLIVYDPQGGHHLWRYSAQSSPSDTTSFLTSFKASSSRIYATPESLVEFMGRSGVIVHKTKSASLINAESSAIDEIQRNLPASPKTRYQSEIKTVPLMDSPPLVGFEKSSSVTKRLPGFNPIPREFLCVPYGGPGQGPCPHGTLIVSISKQGDNWRLVLRNRWDVEIILDSNFNAVSSKQLTEAPKQ